MIVLIYCRFEKVCGAPSWARMRWEKDDSENGKYYIGRVMVARGLKLTSISAL